MYSEESLRNNERKSDMCKEERFVSTCRARLEEVLGEKTSEEKQQKFYKDFVEFYHDNMWSKPDMNIASPYVLLRRLPELFEVKSLNLNKEKYRLSMAEKLKRGLKDV